MRTFPYFTFIILLLSSCLSNKEIQRSDLVKQEIEGLRKLNREKIESGQQSPEIGKAIDSAYVGMETQLTVLQEAVKKNPTDMKLKKKLRLKSQTYQTTIETFIKLYKIETFRAFESSRFFKTGEYAITKEDAKLVMADLDPLINRIVEIIENDKALNIEVILGVYGYTDEQEVAIGGNLYNTLKKLIPNSQPTQVELNQKLSELRAKSLADLIQASVDKRKKEESKKSYILYNINWLGRGFEKLPFKNMIPKKVDEMRRVVTVIWGVKPILVDEN